MNNIEYCNWTYLGLGQYKTDCDHTYLTSSLEEELDGKKCDGCKKTINVVSPMCYPSFSKRR